MRVAVIGAGIIGVTTAFELASDGHEVTVLERLGAVAEGSSFANAGVVAPGYVTPWAAPGMPTKVLSYLFSSHAPVRLSLPLGRAELAWMWRWLRASRMEAYVANRTRLRRLAFYSRERLAHLRDELKLEYERASGYLVLLRSDKERTLVEPGLQLMRDAGVNLRLIDADETRKLEPALNPDTRFSGAIHLPDDEVGNCRQFALLLRAEAQRLGAVFEFGAQVEAIDRSQRGLLRVRSADGSSVERRFDALVLCGGVDSVTLLRPLGIELPLVPVWGYSMSAQIREPLNAPRSALMDERYKVAISRLGQRVRVAGSAELGGRADSKRQSAVQTIYKVLHDWFPGAAKLTHVQEWKGARPMLPDGPPLITPSGIDGLWLNLGHGSSGWALSCGSARAVADLIGGQAPAIDLEGFDLARLR